MVNNSPETVSTDYDTSDKLYFEPICIEHVSNVLSHEKPKVSSCSSAADPAEASHQIGPILGTPTGRIDLCEDRERFNALMNEWVFVSPRERWPATVRAIAAKEARLPLLVRPSYVLGGRAAICFDEDDFKAALEEALEVSEDHPVLLDRFLGGGGVRRRHPL